MNLGDPDLELVDPTPNVHLLFIHFDKMFFWTKLASRAVVRWSKRMYSCAGVCTYEGRCGLCDIALSEPLLKLRPRKDLVETLLHEMIHAFLFVTNRDQDRDGHGPNFKAHMHRINKSAGLNVSIYHDFHDEVKLYQTHWWRCNGLCQSSRPHFGIVRRTCNRAPGPSDYWWEDHRRKCGGTFIKIKEPEKQTKKTAKPKPKEDISKYIKTNIKTINDVTQNTTMKPVLKDSSNVPDNLRTKSNSSRTIVVSKKGVGFNPTAIPKANALPVFTGNGHTINGMSRSNMDVVETVRNVWANKQIPSNANAISKVETSNPYKHKPVTDMQSPPAKIKKIDDYFKTTAKAVLKELYGDDYEISQPNDSMKLVAIKVELVDCPICRAKVSDEEINKHLDECLNTEVIQELSQDINHNIDRKPKVEVENTKNYNNLIDDIPPIPAFKGNKEISQNNISINNIIDSVDLTAIKTEKDKEREQEIDFKKKTLTKFNSIDDCTSIMNRKPNISLRKSDSFITNDKGHKLNTNSEPGTSTADIFNQICPCCGKKFDKSVEEHLDECLIFFDNNSTIPEEGASTSSDIIVIDEDDACDESMVLNATGTKTPCPCCMKMVEQADMNDHLDFCLQS